MPLRAVLLVLLAASAFAAPLDDAVALYQAKKYPEARALLETIAATEPKNAAACYYYGMTLRRRGDPKALEDAVPWLEKAATLAPDNATYLADYGGSSMELAGRTRSISAATRGRDAMEKSLKLNPDNLDAREGLYQFYRQAPWPIGSNAKAAKQLEEIRQRDPRRATLIDIAAKAAAKDYAGAFKLCDDWLAQKPDEYVILLQYGRIAILSGQNLERALDRVRLCLQQPPPAPPYPGHAFVWWRIGNLQEKLSRTTDARVAYETSLQLEPGNRNAAQALAKLK